MQGNRQSGKRMRGRGRAKAQSVTTPGSSSNRNPLQKTSVHVKREKETFRSYKSQDIVMMFVGFVVKAVFSGSCWFCGKRRFFFLPFVSLQESWNLHCFLLGNFEPQLSSYYIIPHPIQKPIGSPLSCCSQIFFFTFFLGLVCTFY